MQDQSQQYHYQTFPYNNQHHVNGVSGQGQTAVPQPNHSGGPQGFQPPGGFGQYPASNGPPYQKGPDTYQQNYYQGNNAVSQPLKPQTMHPVNNLSQSMNYLSLNSQPPKMPMVSEPAMKNEPPKDYNAANTFQRGQSLPPPPLPPGAILPGSVHSPSNLAFSNVQGPPMAPPTQPPRPVGGLQQNYEPSQNQPKQFMPGPRYPQSQALSNQQPQNLQYPHQQYGGQQPGPMPGQQPQPYYGSTGPSPMAANQQQRLDPDAMPSVVQVIEDDRIKFAPNGEVSYTTSIPAAVPPMMTTIRSNKDSVVQDGGCARPNHLLSTVYQVPVTEDVLKTTCVPLSILVKPFDEDESDGNMVIPVSQSEILRCNRCKAYMNPFMRFIDGGRRFQCTLCHHLNEVTQTYFSHLDHTGQRLDKYERPELYLGSYEFKTTPEFCRNNIMNCRRPHIIFAFELTVNSRPVITNICKHLPNIIRTCLPTDQTNPGSLPPMVGFATYNSKITMYDIANNGHAHIICDVANTFAPFTSFLVDPMEYADQIESFLLSLPTLLCEDLETETILGPVVEATLRTSLFDNSNWFQTESAAASNKDPEKVVPVGKVYLFHCTLPTYGQDGATPGRLKPRWITSPEEAKNLLRTDKEKQILTPEPSKYYNDLAQRCVTNYGSGVELFLFPPINGSYLDVATLSELVRLTGSGGIYKYYGDVSDRFITDLKLSLKSTFAFDAIMKVRTSTGVRAVDYYGAYYARTTSDIECAVINAGNTVAVELKYDDKLPEDEFVIVQVAILFTSVSGDRRVRVHNLALSVCHQVADVFRNAYCDAVMNFIVRQAVSTLRQGEKTIQQVKEALISRTVSILAAYRKHCAQPGSSLGQLILPEALKLLPVFITGAIKCDAIDGGPEMTPDDKAYAQILTLAAGVPSTQAILYPVLLRMEYESSDQDTLRAVQVRCSAQRLENQEGVAYLLNNTFYTFLYLPTAIEIPDQNRFLRNVFEVDNVQQIQTDMPLPELLTAESQFLQNLISDILRQNRRTTKLVIVRQGIDKLDVVFRTFLYEDKKPVFGAHSGDGGKQESPSYVDLLCHLHKEIRAQLS